MRELSEKFMNDLTNSDGLLHPVWKRVKQDDTLMLAIRDGYINIYYRGGNLMRIKEQAQATYDSFFDEKYNQDGMLLPELPIKLNAPGDAAAWVQGFPRLKETMDLYFSANPKGEREFQQVVARENNFSSISNESEYFITDIECADSSIGARFDMLAIRWLATQRKNGGNCLPALIEMKYAEGALNGTAGLIKHLEDIEKLVNDKERYSKLLTTMEKQFNQLDQLELLNFKRCSNGTKVKLNADDKPEVILILANHNPRSSKLTTIIHSPEMDDYGRSQIFNLKFYVSTFAGYGLHSDCMLTLDQFRDVVKQKNNA